MHSTAPRPQAAARSLGVLVGLMACVLARHVLGALTSQPWWLTLAVAAACAAVLGRIGRTKGLTLCVGLGICAGLTLPQALPPPGKSVATHGPARSANSDLFAVLDQLDEHPQSLLGRRVTVTGSWTPEKADAAATVSRRVMACCAADAIDVGFDVVPAGRSAVFPGSEVRVSGVVQARIRAGETRYTLEGATVSVLSARSSGER